MESGREDHYVEQGGEQTEDHDGRNADLIKNVLDGLHLEEMNQFIREAAG